eukprot:gene19633-23243_t
MLARFVPKIPRVISNMPEIKIALKWAEFGLVQFPKVLTWAAPGAVFAGWMVYPALTPGFKSQLGLEDNIKPANIEYVEEEDGSTPTL